MTYVLLIWCLAAVPIVLLYTLWGRRQTREVAAFWLWQQTLRRKGPWPRWQRSASLLLQLALLTLLVIALAYPFWQPAAGRSRAFVVVIDVSASMNATDAKPTRLAQAIVDAQQLVASMTPHDRMAVLTAGATPRLVAPLSENRLMLLAALSKIQVTRDTADLDAALQTAEAMLADDANGELWLLTDASSSDLGELNQRPKVHMRVIGGSAANAAITQLAARPLLDDPTRQEIYCEVRNATAQTIEVSLTLTDNATTAPITFPVAAGATLPHLARITVTSDASLEAVIDDADALAEDNRATVRLHAAAKRTVFSIGPAYPPLVRALRAVPGCEVRAVESLPADFPANSVAVFFQTTVDELPPLPCWFIEPRGGSPLWEYSGLFAPPSPVRTDLGREFLADAWFETAVIEQAVKLRPTRDAELLLESAAGEPLAWRGEQRQERVAVFQPILERSDLALRPDLPILAAATIGWLAGDMDERGPTFAADLLAVDESDLSRQAELTSSPLPAPAEPPGPPPVSWLLLAACVALIAEWQFFHRRVTV